MKTLSFNAGRDAIGLSCACWRSLVVLMLVPSLSGCMTSLLNMSDSEPFSERFAKLMSNDARREKEEDDDFDTETKVETPLLRDYISVSGNNMVALRGVGLVTGLDGTGGDPPPSHLRKELMDEMSTMKIPHASRILADRNTALVIVTAYLPPMVREGQRFDVRVTLPPNSEATSLKGGTLLETRLSEERMVAGRGNLKGHLYGIASGAILTALGDGVKNNAAMLRRGSIPGGAVSKTERNLEVVLRNEHRGRKTVQRVESAISNRLHHYNRLGQRIPMAEAKTDLLLELNVHPTYRNNFPRYQHMIRSIAYREDSVARRLRMERLSEELLNPVDSQSAALQLEAIGREGIPFLQAGLTAGNFESRFHSAQALAYLNDSSGVAVLKEAALQEPAFRVYALAALSVINDADSVMALRELVAADDLETRYGAVRAIKETNPRDPVLGTQEFEKQFVLHAIDAGPPAAHVVRYREPEVVIFNSHQDLGLPAVLNAGNRIRIIGRAGEKTVTVTKYHLNQEPERKVTSTNLVEILNVVASLGARYPDIVQMLVEADEGGNLMGELGIDRLPQAGRTYDRNRNDDNSEGSSRVGTRSHTPGLFERLDDTEEYVPEKEESALARMFAQADQNEASDSSNEPDETARTSEGIPAEGDDSEGSSEVQRTAERSDSTDDESYEDTYEELGVEQTEFREPLGNRLRRSLLSPFK